MSKPTEQIDLEEQFFPTPEALAQRWLPWLRLLRGFRMAIDVRRMLIALVAVFLWSAGESLIPASSQNVSEGPRTVWPWEESSTALGWGTLDTHVADFIFSRPPEWISIHPWIAPVQRFFHPMIRAVQPGWEILFTRPATTKMLSLLLLLFLGISISAIFGGAISRMAAVDFARNEEISIRRSLRFSFGKYLSYLGAPLIACAGLAASWLFNFLAGLVASVPVVGEPLVAFFWCFPLLAGFIMAMILLGIGLGWPLMIAAISTEASDAFDGLSRAYSYLLNRPWYALFLAFCMLVYGTILLMFVQGMIQLTFQLTTASFESGFYGNHDATHRQLPSQIHGPLEKLTDGISKNAEMPEVFSTLRTFWTRVVMSIPAAFIFSYFWTMVTIIYFLLRKREDATPLNEVWMPESSGGSKMPLVGIPAAELREKKAGGTASPPDEQSTPEA
ncbi:hypothetical protein SH661x_000567 [Planctomicrobium sp. SH661]|uniref:hypothetical protein n=1 Tax=Planctomicrobium sp. SH661 TaxID=3448124 RepID=UPI003F5C76D4